VEASDRQGGNLLICFEILIYNILMFNMLIYSIYNLQICNMLNNFFVIKCRWRLHIIPTYKCIQTSMFLICGQSTL